jgi:hypothetical protein
MTTPEQIYDGGSVTADLICQRHVAENLIAEEKVQSVGGLSLRDYFAAAAMQGYCSNRDFGSMSDKTLAKRAYELADAMLAARKGGA